MKTARCPCSHELSRTDGAGLSLGDFPSAAFLSVSAQAEIVLGLADEDGGGKSEIVLLDAAGLPKWSTDTPGNLVDAAQAVPAGVNLPLEPGAGDKLGMRVDFLNATIIGHGRAPCGNVTPTADRLRPLAQPRTFPRPRRARACYVSRMRRPPRLLETAAKNAESAKKKLARVAAAARRDVALVKRRKHDIEGAFYDIGRALARLKKPVVIAALGHESFDALCQLELGISVPQADRLIAVTRNMTRGEAKKLGPAKAAALVDLVSATPARDTAKGALHGGVRLPGGERLDPRTASARAMERAAKAVRAATRPATGRGRHVTREELALGAALEKRLRRGGVEHARVTVLAGPPGKPARARIEGIELGELAELARAIRATLGSSRSSA